MKYFISLAFVFITLCGISQSTRTRGLDSLMVQMYNSNQFVGSVLVIESDSTIYKRSFGYADIESKDTLKNTTPINLASLSKHLTATAVMILMDNGKIKAKDPITNFLPELPYSSITVENLLHHTSGIKDYETLTAILNRSGKTMTNEDLVAFYAKKKKKLKFAPGEKFKYSNTGYVLLATIVERISKMSFSDFVDQQIFKKAGFKDSYVFSDQRLKDFERIAWSYTPKYKREDKTFEGKWATHYDNLTGDGAICMSINDMEIWAKALNSGKYLISDSLFEKSITTGYLNNNSPTVYGYGWDLYGGNYAHTGGWHNYNTYYWHDNSNDRTFVILMTNNPDNDNDIIMAIRNCIEKRIFDCPTPTKKQLNGQKIFKNNYQINYLLAY